MGCMRVYVCAGYRAVRKLLSLARESWCLRLTTSRAAPPLPDDDGADDADSSGRGCNLMTSLLAGCLDKPASFVDLLLWVSFT